VKTDELPDFDDQQFGLDLLEQKHVLVAPGSSFNVPYRNRFRVTNLPDATTLREVFGRIEDLLTSYANGGGSASKSGARPTVVEASKRFK
jgi:alanine-synthesizing transaminase